MGTSRIDEYRNDEVRIAQQSGLSPRQFADGLEIACFEPEQGGVNARRDPSVVSDVAPEN